MSEFGRRVDENGSGGVDHGRGGCMSVLGGSAYELRCRQKNGAWHRSSRVEDGRSLSMGWLARHSVSATK
jgi:hypothetical protein